jgi:two-component system NtrC family response regulator
MSLSENRSAAPGERVVHPCLASPAAAVPLAEARLTDRQRVAVLLQAAGLLAALERAGWHLSAGWDEARIAPGGLLAIGEERVSPGRAARAAQESLRDLAARLFGDGRVPGRGEARRAVRALLDHWWQSLVPVPAEAAAAQVLEAAAFLAEPAFAPAREALSREALRPHPVAPQGDGGADRVGLAAALAAAGRFGAALEALAGLRSMAARALAARCQLGLGQLGAARLTLFELEEAELPPKLRVELAEVACRVFNNRGDLERAAAWVRRALDEAGPPNSATGLRARLVAAGSAWDHGDLAAMDRLLDQARPALKHPDLAWRWHHARALRAIQEEAGGPEAVRHMTLALGSNRRGLARREAAGLWNDLGLARARTGDLAGAERAFLHALRLDSGCEGPRRTTLALGNLAEIRLRRGRLGGVWEILGRSEAENRRAGNLRGLTQDAELRARYELVLGRASCALAVCREALAELERQELTWRRAELRLLAARALGWLGRPADAAAAAVELAGTAPETLEELEPEERPAVLAQAGLWEAAVREARDTPFAPLWNALAQGEPPPSAAWEALAPLEPYRAARLVWDCEVLLPGAAPAPWLRAAISTLRKVGASMPAERLEARDQGAWQALAVYCGQEAGSFAGLLAGTGHPEAELVWDLDGERRLLVPGAGGPAELAAECGDGRLTLRAARVDAPARAVFALAVRDLGGRAPEPPPRPVESSRPVSGMVGESPALRAALARLALLAPGDLPVLILGESGTGKELAARQVHRASARARSPFVAVNCAAFSETLLLSDLFGHARGAFTGADREHRGVFETAHGGTVFLDEIGDLPANAQGMLLRVLQEGEIRRVGESAARRVDARVVAATHRDLAHLVVQGSFRQDLFYRLKVGSIELPPLRDRGEDVLRLADHFLNGSPGLSREARARLLAHRWPGNVRELKNVLSVAAALAGGGPIEPEHLELPRIESGGRSSFHDQVEAFRRRLVEDALARHEGRFTEAARFLGISKQGLSYLIRQLGLRSKV